MASKLELRQEIEALCEKHGVSVPEGLQGMNFVTLQGELQRLEAQLAPLLPDGGEPPGLSKIAQPLESGQPGDEGSATSGDGPPPADPPPRPALPPPAATGSGGAPRPAPAVRPVRYVVAQGKMIQNTKKGRIGSEKIGAFKPVEAKDLEGGEAELKQLLDLGIVVTKP
ncbi:MAG TPA: hypothetical protein VJN18_32880 [Polyangiaceae bacterium]|nr:hypothetical protein [Polyangiaceae bacterium]